jgi:putative peptidoglycan lipid II flippase
MLKSFKNKNSVMWVMGLLFITKVLGFLKLRIIAQIFGATHELDIFWAAFTLPDLIFTVLVAGSLNAAIIPIFSELLYGKGKKALDKIFNNLLIFTPQLTSSIFESNFLQQSLNIGTRLDSQDLDLFIQLTRIMLISPILLGISNITTAYLQVKKQFFTTSLAPLFYNLAMIFGPILFVSVLDMGIEGVAYSVILGSLLHLLIQIPQLVEHCNRRCFNFGIKSIIDAFKDTHVWKTLKLAAPRTVGVLGGQASVAINTLISFSLNAGALSAYKFAYSLHLFPVNIVGSAVAQVSLPEFSQHSEKKDMAKLKKTFDDAIQLSMFLVLPIVAVMIILRLPLVRLAYGTGAFDWRATLLTAWSLALLGVSVITQVLAQIFVRVFYALKNTKLPLIAIFVGIVVNIAGAYFLTNFFSHYYDWRPIVEQIWFQVSTANGAGLWEVIKSFFGDLARWSTSRGNSDMGIGGLALSMSLSYLFEVIVLAVLLEKKTDLISWKETVRPLIMKFVNTGIMMVGMYFVFRLFDMELDTTRTIQVIILTVITMTYGGLSYLIGAKVFRIDEYDIVMKKVRKLVVRFGFKNEECK